MYAYIVQVCFEPTAGIPPLASHNLSTALHMHADSMHELIGSLIFVCVWYKRTCVASLEN